MQKRTVHALRKGNAGLGIIYIVITAVLIVLRLLGYFDTTWLKSVVFIPHLLFGLQWFYLNPLFMSDEKVRKVYKIDE